MFTNKYLLVQNYTDHQCIIFLNQLTLENFIIYFRMCDNLESRNENVILFPRLTQLLYSK